MPADKCWHIHFLENICNEQITKNNDADLNRKGTSGYWGILTDTAEYWKDASVGILGILPAGSYKYPGILGIL